MTASISARDCGEFNENTVVFWHVLELGVRQARRQALTDQEKDWVDALAREIESPGNPTPAYEAVELFPQIEQQAFWGRVFKSVAQNVFERTLGDHAEHGWQVSAITGAKVLGDLLSVLAMKGEMARRRASQQRRP